MPESPRTESPPFAMSVQILAFLLVPSTFCCFGWCILGHTLQHTGATYRRMYSWAYHTAYWCYIRTHVFLGIPYGILVLYTDACIPGHTLRHTGATYGRMYSWAYHTAYWCYIRTDASCLHSCCDRELSCISRLCMACVVGGWVFKPIIMNRFKSENLLYICIYQKF